ncbi:von Willebrand factor type A domain-containing protein [Bacteroides salyersiae]|jgi:putative outer membrane protein|uniref:vWA domain-containing protein n=1 Tax=Bacteroides salyersiae TaxID=291644 RepID=UPI001C37EACF|nr:VWA domain-containing protein [Bacteroides salyersiae]MBV4205896.1 von Willebrand factor type A domain-containing protein [Bacteroides salyersiae]MCB6651114.1 von Willebrand factor type A domain-containing protein [Bacteroides salyersiae]
MKTNRLRATMFGLLVAIISLGNVNAETFIVKGKVTDAADGSGIIGCTVQVKGTTRSTITNVDGEYTIRADKGEKLVFSYIGYEKQEAEVKSERLNIRLKTSSQVLEECVVVGYGTQKMVSLCGAVGHATPGIMASRMDADGMNAEEYKEIAENNFKTVSESPLSTFSIDVDAASYSNMRRYINKGELPPADAIRTEELINYFSYDYPQPTGNDPVKITTEVGACPWNVKHRLVRIGLKAKEIPTDKLPVSNLVFLIDVSGSMYGPQRLGLVQSSLKLLVNNLRDEDRVAIVVYSGSAGEKLPSTSGSDKQKIREAIDELTAGGSTAGGAGIKLAYKMAKQNFVKGGNNRIILCTDGDFNVGVSSDEGLEKLIEQERKSGVFLTVLGYGMGNYKDSKMQVLAEKGNGNHAYIDNLQEANRVLVNEFGATMHTVAKDVKLQIEFNPSQVQAYRLIGYESRLLKDEDFNNDAKDAGEMGAGHTVTAFYEVVPAGIKSDFTGKVDDLKYQKTKPAPAVTNNSKELLTVKLRYKAPDGNTSKKIEQPLIDDKKEKVSSDFRFASAVAMFGQLLRDSDFKGDATYDKVISLAKTSLDNDEKGYRREFIRLAETAEGLAKD